MAVRCTSLSLLLPLSFTDMNETVHFPYLILVQYEQCSPLTQKFRQYDAFSVVCDDPKVLWAHMMNADTGEILESYSQEPTSWSN